MFPLPITLKQAGSVTWEPEAYNPVAPTKNPKPKAKKEDVKPDKCAHNPGIFGKTRSRSGTIKDAIKDALPNSTSRSNTLSKENDDTNKPVLLSKTPTRSQTVNKDKENENSGKTELLSKTRTRSQTINKDSAQAAAVNNPHPTHGILKSRSRSNTLHKAEMDDPHNTQITKPPPAHTKLSNHRSRPSNENIISEPHELKTPKGVQSRSRSDSHHGHSHSFHLKIPSPIKSFANTMRRDKKLPIPPSNTQPGSAIPAKTRFSLESPQRSSSAPPWGPEGNACIRYKYTFACGHESKEKVPCEDHFPAFCLDLWHCLDKVLTKSERCEDCQIEVDLAMEAAKLSLRIKSSSVLGAIGEKAFDEKEANEQKTPRDRRLQNLMDSVPSSGLGGSSSYSSTNNLSSSPYTETVTYNFNPSTNNYIATGIEGGLSPAPNFKPGFPRSRSRSFTALTQSLRTKKSDLGIHSTTGRTTTMQTAVSMFSSENSNFFEDSLLDNVFEQQRRARSRSSTLNSGGVNGGISARAMMTGGVPGVPGSERLCGLHAPVMSRSDMGHAPVTGSHLTPRDLPSDTRNGRNIGGRDLGSSMLYRGELSMESLTGANMFGVPTIMPAPGRECGRTIRQPNQAKYGMCDAQMGNLASSIYNGRKESGASNYSFAAHVVRQQARSRSDTLNAGATFGEGMGRERPLPDPSAYAGIGNFYIMSSPSVGQNTPTRTLHSPLRATIGGGRSRSATASKSQINDNAFFAEGKEPTLPTFPPPTVTGGGRSRSATASRPQAENVFADRENSRHELPDPYPSNPSIRNSVAHNTVAVTRSATVASQVPVLSEIYDENGVFIMSSPPSSPSEIHPGRRENDGRVKSTELEAKKQERRQSLAESLNKALPEIPAEGGDNDDALALDVPDAEGERRLPRSTTGLYGPLQFNFGSQFLAATGTTGGIVNLDSTLNNNGLPLSRSRSLNHGSSNNGAAVPIDINATATRASLPGVHAMNKLLMANMDAYEHLPAAPWDFHLPGNAVERSDYNRSLPVPGDATSRGDSRRDSTGSKETLVGDDDADGMNSSFNEEGIIDSYYEKSSPGMGEQDGQEKQRQDFLASDQFTNVHGAIMNDNNSKSRSPHREKPVFGPVTPPGLRARLNTKRYNHSQPPPSYPSPPPSSRPSRLSNSAPPLLELTHLHPHQPSKPTGSGDFSWFNLNGAPRSSFVPPSFEQPRYGQPNFGGGGGGAGGGFGGGPFPFPFSRAEGPAHGFSSFDGPKPGPEFLKAHYAKKAAERAVTGEREQAKGRAATRGPVGIPPNEENTYGGVPYDEDMIGIAMLRYGNA